MTQSRSEVRSQPNLNDRVVRASMLTSDINREVINVVKNDDPRVAVACLWRRANPNGARRRRQDLYVCTSLAGGRQLQDERPSRDGYLTRLSHIDEIQLGGAASQLLTTYHDRLAWSPTECVFSDV